MTDVELKKSSLVAVALVVAVIGLGTLLPGGHGPQRESEETMSFVPVYVAAVKGDWQYVGNGIAIVFVGNAEGAYGALADGARGIRAYRLNLVDVRLGGTVRFRGSVAEDDVSCVCRVNDALSGFTVEWQIGPRCHVGPVEMQRYGENQSNALLERMRGAIASLEAR